MRGLKDLLVPKTLHWFSYVANVFWILLGITLSVIFLDIENSEPRFDFHCGSIGDKDKDKELIRGKCYEQYEKQYNKFGIPVYGFVIINLFVTASVCGIYSQAVNSRVEDLKVLERDNNQSDVERPSQPRNNNLSGKRLFKAYCLQLLARFVFGISFVLLQTKLLYPLSFPSNFNCNLTKDGKSVSDITASASRNITQTQMFVECHNQRATKKTFWAYAVIIVTGAFAFLAFIESLYLLHVWRAKKREKFTEDPKFHKYYLSSNKPNRSTAEQEQELPLIISNRGGDYANPTSPILPEPQQHEYVDHRPEQPSNASLAAPLDSSINHPQTTSEETSAASSIEKMKNHVREATKRPAEDLKLPFDDPGEGRDLTLDEIFTNLTIYKGRAKYVFSGDRREQLKEYNKANEELSPTLPGEIFDPKEKKILVVGRPGIGKTMLSTKILRDWASDNLLKETQKLQIDFAFLIKLRMFNSTDKELNLRELLEHSEYSTALSQDAWNYICNNPDRVLIIFDGFDEYSRKTEINMDEVRYRNNEEDRMPVHFLLKKIVSGKILTGATVLTTTRPNAVSCIRSLDFNKTVEILGFTTEQVNDYIQKLTKHEDRAQTIMQHITSNLNLLAFCYIPVNCFIICSCLLKLLANTSSSTSLHYLPTKLTEIYSIAIRMFYFSYDDEQYRHNKAKGQQYFLKPFNKLPSSVQTVFKRLGKIAFDGIKGGRLIFESGEVGDLESNGFFHRLRDSFSGLTEGRAQYCFLHLTIQEFLAAKYLVDTFSSEELQKFVSSHIQDGTWKVVIHFVAGLLAEQEGPQSTDIFSDLLPSKTDTEEDEIEMNEDSGERNETKISWPADKEDKALVLTIFNCMYENNASDREVQNKLAEIGCNALNLSFCNLSPLDCLALVHALKSVEGILDFDFSSNNLQSLGCIEIVKLLPGNKHCQGLCKVNTLNLSRNKITDKGVQHLSTALTQTNCKLNSLHLEVNNITDEGVEHLSTALKHPNCKLNSLHLGANNITDKGVEHLSKALTHTNCTELNSLNLRLNNITDEGVEHLCTALTHTYCKLNSLNLGYNNITDKGVKHLSTALTHTNCTELNSLNLEHNNNITDKGVKHLSTALTHTNCRLNTLHLRENIIADKGVKHLSTALTHTNCNLNSLDLSYNNITDEGLNHLSTALAHSNCKLNRLHLGLNDRITQKGKNLLKSMNINCKVII